MTQHRNNSKVLTFRQPTTDTPDLDFATQARTPIRKLHPKAKRRRLIWLVSAILFFIWFGVQLVIQQMKIWDREDILAKKSQELEKLRQESQRLDQDLQRLEDPKYLLEQAHRLGYGKKNEQNFELESE
ncbi:septum formation initiator family protein [Thermoactinomyces sp. DSM 45892]|uniref:FtsB family cell division protein n=1 Tax=Thermoactinomyces sp. DSM 45892 TaxID=1882753 RepID=UPI00089A72BF|nr:septum formation initiator family protein [Thermoactinomyces sp. DSM 45892]SDY94821.1 Cell division protein FtsB [Thermoactinomyces sp. DSM 45892]